MITINKVIMVLTLVFLTNIFFAWNSVDAKRGCANFGHACYGGMGKRGDLASSNEEIVRNNMPDAENSAYAVAGPIGQMTNANIPRPLRYRRLLPEQYEQGNKYIRELIINYLRKEDEIERN